MALPGVPIPPHSLGLSCALELLYVYACACVGLAALYMCMFGCVLVHVCVWCILCVGVYVCIGVCWCMCVGMWCVGVCWYVCVCVLVWVCIGVPVCCVCVGMCVSICVCVCGVSDLLHVKPWTWNIVSSQ